MPKISSHALGKRDGYTWRASGVLYTPIKSLHVTMLYGLKARSSLCKPRVFRWSVTETTLGIASSAHVLLLKVALPWVERTDKMLQKAVTDQGVTLSWERIVNGRHPFPIDSHTSPLVTLFWFRSDSVKNWRAFDRWMGLLQYLDYSKRRSIIRLIFAKHWTLLGFCLAVWMMI